MKKFLVLVLLLFTGGFLSSCNEVKMVKPKGKKVELSLDNLEARLNKISINENSIYQIEFESSGKHIYEDQIDFSCYYKDVHNKDTNRWLDYNFTATTDEGVLKGKFSGYQNKRSSYVDINYSGYGYDILEIEEPFNGKYRVRINEGSFWYDRNDLEDFQDYLMPFFFYFTFDNFDAFDPELVLTLYENNFDKISFYEDDQYLSFKFKVNLDDLKQYLDNVDEDLEQVEFEMVLVAKRNTIEAFSVKTTIIHDDGDERFEIKQIFTMQTLNKAPKIPNFDMYEEIEDIDEILKFY